MCKDRIWIRVILYRYDNKNISTRPISHPLTPLTNAVNAKYCYPISNYNSLTLVTNTQKFRDKNFP
jgi:hypothetical protein